MPHGIGVPAVAYSENWHYLQFYVGSVIARLVITFVLLPAVLRTDSTTLYGFLRRRLGKEARWVSVAFFFLLRMLASGVSLMAAAAAIGILLGWPLGPTIALFVIVGAAYIAMGGLRGVVWGNVLQAGVQDGIVQDGLG